MAESVWAVSIAMPNVASFVDQYGCLRQITAWVRALTTRSDSASSFLPSRSRSFAKHHSATRWLALAALALLPLRISTANAQSTAFSYQGQLNASGKPVSGLYDLRFQVWDAQTNGNPIGLALTNSATLVTNGKFTVTLDFGPGVFTGPGRWLELDVRTNGTGAFGRLLPFQQLLPMPYAIMANSASNLLGPLPAAQLSGSLPASLLAGYDRAVTFSNLANRFVGTFIGNGGGLTNFSGAAIQPGTVSSAALDGPTKAQLALAGKAILPFVVVFTDGTYMYNGAVYTATNTTTCGIQEAINALLTCDGHGKRSAGGTVIFDAGDYRTTSAITIPYGTNLCTVNFQGAGKSATMIQYVGTRTQAVLSVRAQEPYNYLSFSMRDMAVATTVNGCTNILEFIGTSPTIGQCTNGFDSLHVERCWVKYGTNRDNYISSPAWTSHMRNNIGIYVDQNYNDPACVKECSIMHCAVAISWACDWGTIQNNSLSFVGRNQDWTYTSSWPSTSPYYIGGGILIRETSNGPWNGHKMCHIMGNEFVGCYPHYISTVSPSFYAAPIVTYYDGDEEPVVPGVPIAVTYGQKVVIVNPSTTFWNTPGIFTNYLLPSITDFTNWKSQGCPSNLVTFVDDVQGTNSGGYGFGGPVYAKSFNASSDRNEKEQFTPIESQEILDRVVSLPISTWNFKADRTTRHIGPMAQDFYAAFQVGTDNRHIATVDEGGVALAAIQGLNQKLNEKAAEIQHLEKKLDDLQALVRKAASQQ